jgi:FtsZ-interacting cell division protein YlmF
MRSEPLYEDRTAHIQKKISTLIQKTKDVSRLIFIKRPLLRDYSDCITICNKFKSKMIRTIVSRMTPSQKKISTLIQKTKDVSRLIFIKRPLLQDYSDCIRICNKFKSNIIWCLCNCDSLLCQLSRITMLAQITLYYHTSDLLELWSYVWQMNDT